MTLDRFAYLGEPHHQVLETLTARALERGELHTAYRLADRRCRIRPLADAHCFVLRAEALFRMGERAAAIDDIEAALEIAPEDLAGNRRMLSWGKSRAQLLAAERLIDCEQDFRVLKQAIALLRKRRKTAFAAMQVRGDVVEGWAAWQGRGQIGVVVADESCRNEQLFEAHRRHPLAEALGNAVSFRLPRRAAPQLISVVNEGDVLCEVRTGAWDKQQLPLPVANGDRPGSGAAVTVIVPVHGDLAATKACLESLLTQLDQAGRHQVIVVNDASPDRRIVRLLELLAASNHVRVLTNPRNLGFVGAVNRALREVSAGDVILLNADTIVPQGFIERLAAEACASPEIGTVTPLSNNGEFMSFPVPNRANIAGTAVEVAMIDRIAERTNAGLLVDVPNGIGFCLYITRDCLDAVGLLSESYQRGYLEDVDFCLRARRHGFRNVCAPSVYVGHAGSRSFKRKKRSLVVRNLRVVEQRFPAYRAECASFVLADPLKNARRAIELGMMASCSHSMLLVTPGGVAAEIARERARQRPSDDDCAALILQIGHEPGHIVATLRDVNGGVPQSLELRLPAGAPAELIEVLRRVPLRRMEIFAPDAIPPTIINALLDLSVAYDVFLSHAPDLSACHGVIAGAERILIPDAQAASVASALAHSGLTVLPQAAIGRHPPLRRVSKKAARPGLLPITRCTREHHFVRRLTATLAKERPDLDVVTIGSTPDDTELMRAGVFVTGSVEANELHALVRRYQLDRMIVCATQPLFGHPLLAAAMACAIPVAFFDWSGGRCRARDGDLALEPPVSAEFAAARLLPWLEEFKSA